MPQLETRIEGLDQIERDWLRLSEDIGPRRARTIFNVPLRRAFAPVEADIRANTPVDTGGLMESIRTNAGGPRRAELRSGAFGPNDVVVVRSGWFWRGTSRWFQATNTEYGNSRQAPGNILRGALESNANRILQNLAQTLGEAIERRAARYARTGR